MSEPIAKQIKKQTAEIIHEAQKNKAKYINLFVQIDKRAFAIDKSIKEKP